jgi:hypothetical protein
MRTGWTVPRMTKLTSYFDLDIAATHEQFGFASVGSGKRMSLKASFVEALGRLPDRIIDARERLVA